VITEFTLFYVYLKRHRRQPLFMFIQVTVGDSVCTGVGSNKKLAKRVAAEQMLIMLGYSLTPPPPAKPALKSSTESLSSADATSAVSALAAGSDKHVTFAERDKTTSRRRFVTF